MKKAKDITLQVRGINSSVKEKAEKVAKKSGFSTLQDAIRVFVADLAQGERIQTNMKVEYASPKLQKTINEAMEEYRRGEYITLESDEDILQHTQQLLKEIDDEERVQSQKNKKIRKKREETSQI